MVNPKTNRPSYNPLDACLVNLTVQFKNGHTANALIDPGSELNIMGHETWLQTSEPMDRRTTTFMRDASNHVTNLRGKCFNVDIMSGNFKTTSDFWVGNVPLEILCGQPWQVQNKINIEERNDGTWLSHRAVSGEAVWEVCAVPAQNPTDDGMNSHLFGHHHHPHCHHHHPFHHAETRQKPPPEVDENYAYT